MTDIVQKKPGSPGPPSLLTDDMRRKIEEVAALDGTVEEMAYYCGVHRSTLYNWFKEDPDLFDRVEALRQRPVLKARKTVVQSLEDPDRAFRYLERKRSKEFALTQKTELSGSVGVQQVRSTNEIDLAADALAKEYDAKLRQLYAAPEEKIEAPAEQQLLEAPQEQTYDIQPTENTQ